MSKRKHASVIQAWLDGKELESRPDANCSWVKMQHTNPMTDDYREWRVVPDKKQEAFIEWCNVNITKSTPDNTLHIKKHAWFQGFESALKILADDGHVTEEDIEQYK